MENVRAIFLMTAAMAFFALSDAFIKSAARTLDIGQILMMSCALSAGLFALLLLRSGTPLISRDLTNRFVLIRTGAEVFGSLGFVLSLSLIPLSTVTAVAQAMPLTVTLGAALFLGERVGWRRWSAVLIGFLGVLVIVRPGSAVFGVEFAWLGLAIIGLTVRDLTTRLLPPHVTSVFVSAWAMAGLAVLGYVLMTLQGSWLNPTPADWLRIAGVSITSALAFITLTASLRSGEVSAIAPFRYTRLIFGLLIAILMFGERLDAAMWVGTLLIVGSGLYAFWRERRLGEAAKEAAAA